MEAIVIRVRLDSTTIELPELQPHLGKSVEIKVQVQGTALTEFRSSPNAASELLEQSLVESGALSRLA
jgi:hypothetical protein